MSKKKKKQKRRNQSHHIVKRIEIIQKTTLLDLWKIAKQTIEHEHNLTSHRVTRYLTIQGFLFTLIIGIFWACYVEPTAKSALFYVLMCLYMLIIWGLAVITADIMIKSAQAAKIQISRSGYWFLKQCEKYPNIDWLNFHARLKDQFSKYIQPNLPSYKEDMEEFLELQAYMNLHGVDFSNSSFKTFFIHDGTTSIHYPYVIRIAWHVFFVSTFLYMIILNGSSIGSFIGEFCRILIRN